MKQKEKQPCWAGRQRLHYEEIDSTNVQAAREAALGAMHGLLVTAESQTAGRGRRGRVWSSPAGVNLYLSLLLRPQQQKKDLRPEQAAMLTLVMALAAQKAVCKVAGCVCGIKWPNDLVVNGQKICGILTECKLEQNQIDSVVIGVGVNLREQEFPEEVASRATWLERECGIRIEKEVLLQSILCEFEECYEQFLKSVDLSMLKQDYEAALVNLGRSVRVLDPQGEYTGISKGIDTLGDLLVEVNGAVQKVYAGEVSVRGLYGYV